MARSCRVDYFVRCFKIQYQSFALAFKGWLLLLLRAAGIVLPVLLPAAGIAECRNDTSTFSCQVAASCSFSGLESSYGLRNLVAHDGTPRLQSYAHSFNVNSNSSIRVTIEYSILQEPPGFVPELRWASFRQRVGSVYQSAQYLTVPNQQLTPMQITETPGTAVVAAGMLVQPASQPGNYEYRMTVTCLL